MYMDNMNKLVSVINENKALNIYYYVLIPFLVIISDKSVEN